MCVFYIVSGIRPERLQHFDDQCWKLMQECWAGEPSKRPLLGYVQPLLESILDKYLNANTRGSSSGNFVFIMFQ